MTEAPQSGEPAPGSPPWYRQRLPLLGAALLLVVVVVVSAVVALGGGGEGGDGAAAAAPTTALASTAPAPPSVPPADPAAPPVNADEPPPALPAAPLDDPVVVEEVTAELSSIEEIEAEGRGRGGVSGPALRVTVRIHNGAATPLSLDDVSVTLAFGADSTPASPVDDPSGVPFGGGLESGGSAEGVYVFRVPTGERGAVTVQVGVRPGTAVATFAGAVD
jgi:hypothetical protein